jgi:hypothetical protein
MPKQATSYDLRKYYNITDIPRGPLSMTYLVDPVNGSDGNPGTNIGQPLKTLEAAEDLCVGDQHDAVLFLSGDTADNPAASIDWDKDYTHLIGLSSGVYGLGQRCRVVALAGADITVPISFKSNGCIVKNMQFNNEHADTAATGCAIVTGQRNYFENVFFMAPTSDTAASYSLKMAGAENVFKHCTIGQQTNFRENATYGLWLHKGAGSSVSRNLFDECMFLSWQGGAGSPHVHVLVDADIIAVPWLTIFKDSIFVANYGGGTIQAQAIDDNCTAAGHQIVLWGKNSFGGCSVVADVLTYILVQHFSHGGVMAALEESAET